MRVRPFLVLLAAALAASVAPVVARAEVAPRTEQELAAEATHIVTGTVRGHFAAERKNGPGSRDTEVATELLVDGVEKGDGPQKGQVVHLRWARILERPDGWAGPSGMYVDVPVGARARYWVRRDADGVYRVLRPNGAAVLATASAPSAGAPAADVPLAETQASLRNELGKLLEIARAGDGMRTVDALRAWVLPDASKWFTSVYGAERGARGAVEYAPQVAPEALTGLAGFVRSMAEGMPAASLEIQKDGPDRIGTANAKAADKMVTRTSLWTARVGSKNLWAIVFADGGWRVAGKMRASLRD